jgi:hypothetical protein
VITVTSQRGDSDSTAPFWIGVAPKQNMVVDSSQKTFYTHRYGDLVSTDPIVVNNTVGELQFSKPASTQLYWDTATGVMSYPNSKWSTGTPTYSTTITDEFNRTITFTWSAEFRPALVAKAAAATASQYKSYTLKEPVLKPTVTGLLGNATWTVTDLPDGLSIDPTSGAVHGTISATAATGDYNVTYTITDSKDGKTASASGTITVL